MTSNKKENNSNEKPIWFKRSEEEVEALVVKLVKQGLTSEKIGLVLRDTYGVPSTKLVVGKISKIIAKNMDYAPVDLTNLEKRSIKLRGHINKNKQDKVARRDLGITEAKIKKLKKYYSKKKLRK